MFKTTLKLGAQCGILGAIGYSYLAYRCKKLRHENMDFDLTEARKDTTRPSNVYYGLNWGYRSDETLEKSLDTGDLLFFNYTCDNCFTPREVISCYLQKQMHKLENLQDDGKNVENTP